MDITYNEISNQPKSWKRTLESVPQQWSKMNVNFDLPNTHVLFIGCGTSLYLAHSAARLFQEVTGMVALASPASEIVLASQAVVPTNVPVLAFAISRSGTTSEVLMAVEYLHQNYQNVKTVGVTCYSEKDLACLTHSVITLDHARENSVVMTQSFTNMLLAIQWIAAKVSNRADLLGELNRLPGALEQALDAVAQFGSNTGSNSAVTQFIYLGLGAYYGLAEEGTLKLKEMTQTPCEWYNPLEFRHGPISLVEKGTAIVFVVSREHALYIQDVIEDVKKLGAFVIVVAPADIADSCGGSSTLSLPEGFSDWSRTPLYMPPLQFLAHARAVSLGLNPDQPRNLNQVVILNPRS